MMKLKIWKIVCLIWIPLSACTDFVIQAEDKTIVNGRSMEFGVDLEPSFIVIPANTKMNFSLNKEKKAAQWTTKYALVGVSVFDTDSLVDGMNEKGLSLGALWLPGTKYPSKVEGSKKLSISVFDFTGWALGSFATVDEVKAGLQMVEVVGEVVPQLKETPPLHFSIHDALGKSLVVEFVNGKMEIAENAVGVLTNAPVFEWHVTNLRNYINLSALNVKPVKIDGSTFSQTGQGSGLLGLPGDWTPPSRFVRMAIFKSSVAAVKDANKCVNLAFHLLNTVDIPYGVVRSSSSKDFDYTQWVVVKDLMHQRLYFRTYQDLDIRLVDLKAKLKNGQEGIQHFSL